MIPFGPHGDARATNTANAPTTPDRDGRPGGLREAVERLAEEWAGRHSLVMTGDSVAHDLRAGRDVGLSRASTYDPQPLPCRWDDAMTWLSTWPHDGCPQYREHGSEPAAEEHARSVGGVAFWSSDEGPRGAAGWLAGVEVAPESHGHAVRPKWNDPIEGTA